MGAAELAPDVAAVDLQRTKGEADTEEEQPPCETLALSGRGALGLHDAHQEDRQATEEEGEKTAADLPHLHALQKGDPAPSCPQDIWAGSVIPLPKKSTLAHLSPLL